MIRETVGHLRDLPRYRQILTSLMRYGYQDVVAALHLEGLVRPIERAALGDGVPPQDRARRLRLVCEDLGPTFVKLGQLLSTRPDLLPESYVNELAGLRDDVRPFSFDQVETILSEEYGRPASEVFASRRPDPGGLGVDLSGPSGGPPGRPDHRPEGPAAGDRQGRAGRPGYHQEPGAPAGATAADAGTLPARRPGSRVRAHLEARARFLGRTPDHAALPHPVRQRLDGTHPGGLRGILDARA